MPEGWTCRCGRGTLYDVLQVSPFCEPEVIQAAFRALARSRHPDVNRSPDAEEQMRRLNVAYQTLSDPALRARYDEELALEAARPPMVRPAPAAGTGTGAGSPRTGAAPAGARAGAGSASGASSASAYQPTMFDGRSDMVLPRSTVYVSVVMVIVIVVLLVLLMLEYLANSPVSPSPVRTPAGYQQPASSAPSWSFDLSGPSVEPGLSPPRSR